MISDSGKLAVPMTMVSAPADPVSWPSEASGSSEEEQAVRVRPSRAVAAVMVVKRIFMSHVLVVGEFSAGPPA